MYPVESAHDEADRKIQQDRLRVQDEVSQRRYHSEQRDRGFVRRALRRGVPAQDIEDRLLGTTEFQRLNPDRDPRAYVRGLIDEEGSGLRNVDIGESEGGAGLPRPPGVSHGSGNESARASEAAAQRYIQENFESNDWLAVVVRNREAEGTVQRITTAQQIASSEFQSWLRYKNAHGSDIYLSLNTLREHSHSRTKADIKDIRHLYLDLDTKAPQKLAALYQDSSVPHPNYVLQTSADKYQVVWRVEGLQQSEAEDLLRRMAQHFGADPAATDSTRVFRLPGFNNKKYERDFAVKLAPGARPEPVHRASEFKIPRHVPEPAAERGDTGTKSTGTPGTSGTQSERDWAYALRHLRQGEAPERVIQDITAFRSVDRHDSQAPEKALTPIKPNPRYYAEHTVQRAMEYLGMTDRQVEPPAESRPGEVEPNR